MSETDAQRLCLSCGLCCSGAFFGSADVEPEEDTKRMIDRGLLLEPFEDQYLLRLPCEALKDGRCACYGCRPAVCQSYRCRLLKRLDRQKCTFEAARSAVAQAKELMSRLSHRVQQEFPELADLTLLEACDAVAERFAALEGDERVKFGQSHQGFYLAHAAYSLHIEEHFHRHEK